MIQRLKEETRELHEQVEEQNLAKKIMDHSINVEIYKLLLVQNFIAYSATEKAIREFLPGYNGKKHEQLRMDLQQLGVSEDIMPENEIFKCQSTAEAFGAAYVVEGSALGGMLLARNLKKCNQLAAVEQHHFFNGDKTNLKDWNSFKEKLEQYDFSEKEEKEALEKAKDTFRFFQSVFRQDFVLG